MEGKKNFVYILMMIAIIGFIIYSFQSSSENNEKVQDTNPDTLDTPINFTWKDDLNVFLNNFKVFKKTRDFKFIVLITVVFLLLGFLWIIRKGKKDFVKEEVIKMVKQQRTLYAEPVQDKSKYDLITKETTQKEIEKLYENERFKKMLNEKGETLEKWNWQSREKAKRTVFREDKSDTSDEHMSQVDLSDNDN